jgi:hypothetical protein
VSLIESALTFGLVITVIFFSWEFCMLIYTYTVLADAANEGVRYAMVHSSDSAGTAAVVRTYAAYSLHDVSGMDVSVTYPDGSSSPPARVAVKITYTYIPYLETVVTPKLTTFAEGRLLY